MCFDSKQENSWNWQMRNFVARDEIVGCLFIIAEKPSDILGVSWASGKGTLMH